MTTTNNTTNAEAIESLLTELQELADSIRQDGEYASTAAAYSVFGDSDPNDVKEGYEYAASEIEDFIYRYRNPEE